jgi:hypothetical protein
MISKGAAGLGRSGAVQIRTSPPWTQDVDARGPSDSTIPLNARVAAKKRAATQLYVMDAIPNRIKVMRV